MHPPETTAAIDALPDGSVVVANEYVRARAEVLRENIVKWGYDRVYVSCGDTRAFRKLKEEWNGKRWIPHAITTLSFFVCSSRPSGHNGIRSGKSIMELPEGFQCEFEGLADGLREAPSVSVRCNLRKRS